MSRNITKALAALILLFAFNASYAQLTGTKNIPGDYATLAAAITDLNAQGVGSGGVTINLLAGNPQTAPATGYVITASGTAANTIAIQGNGNIITAFTPLTAGILTDAFFTIGGGDYITIRNFTMNENAGNTVGTPAASNTMMEFGVVLARATTTNGAKFNTVSNCTINLRNVTTAYVNTIGIYSNARHDYNASFTAAVGNGVGGENSNNTFATNTITGVTSGIVVIGDATNNDVNNTVGGASVAQANTITFGTNTSAMLTTYAGYSTANMDGVFMTANQTATASYNTITLNTGSTQASNGVLLSASAAGTYTNTISNNTINQTGTAGAYNGIQNSSAGNANSTITISGNTINTVTGGSATNGITTTAAAGTINITNNNVTVRNGAAAISGIVSAGAGVTLNMTGNTVDVSTTGTTSTVQFLASTSTVTGSISIQNNTLKTASNLTTTSGTVYLINNNNSTNNITVSGNKLQGSLTKSGSGGTFYGYYNFGTPTGGMENIYANNFSNITLSGTTVFIGINSATGPSSNSLNGRLIYNDTISNITLGAHTSLSTGILVNFNNGPLTQVYNNRLTNIITAGTTFNGISLNSSGYGGAIYSNYISGISGTGASATIIGVLLNPNTTTGVATERNDTITGLSVAGNTTAIIRGISIVSGISDSSYQNVVYNLSATTTTGSASINGIAITGSTTPNVYRNNIFNLSAGTSAGTSTQVNGINISTVTTGSNVFNNFTSGLTAPSAVNVNAVVGINASATGTLTNKLYFNTIALGFGGAISGGTNFGATGILYPTSATALTDVKNNYITVNATASGTGINAVIRRNTAAATANVPPVSGNFTASNNVYSINAGTNNFIYVDATDNTTIKNGYALSGLTADLVNNIVNDLSFNTACGLYKSFMTGREGGTAIENTLIAGPNTGTFVPVGISYAESGGVTIASPSITTDFSGALRSNPPDIGALQFSGTGIDISAPTIALTGNPANTYCLDAPTVTATITDLTGINIAPGTAPRLYFRKTTDANAFGNYPTDNNSTFNGWKYVEGTGTPPNFSFQIDYSLLQSPAAAGDVITYFVAAQDVAAIANVSVNSAGLASGYCLNSVNLPAAAGPTTGSPASNTYTILTKPVLSVSPVSPGTTCGTPVKLNINGTPLFGNGSIGTAASTTIPSTTLSTLGPNPMQDYYGGTKQQMLFLASELTALGIGAGYSITSVSINMATASGTTLQSFRVKMGTTANSSISAFATGLTTVYPPTDIVPVVGINTFNFTTPFVWDGSSNLIVEMNYSNNNSPSSGPNTATFSTTAFQSTIFYRADNLLPASMDAYGGAPTFSYSARNNVNFTSNLSFPNTWTPIGNAYTDALATIAYTGGLADTIYVKPENNTQYQVITSYGACADTMSMVVTVTGGYTALAGTAASTETDSALVIAAATEVRYSDCDLMATVTPSGGNPIAGNTDVSVTLDAVVQTFNTQPYLQRHFDIVPDANLNSATGTVTLYAYQTEFDAYNTAAGLYPPLPTGAVDNGNVRITEFHGTGTAPGNYTGVEELITPTVSWDATNNWWVMTFPITGAGGFYIHTNLLNGALAIKIGDITAANAGTRNRVDWNTATEERGSIFTVERSIDGSHFTAIGDVNAKGSASNYTFWDEKPANGINYYRLKITEASHISYTKVVTATVKSGNGFAINAYPNPVLNSVTLNVLGEQGANASVIVTDVTGKVLRQMQVQTDKATVDMTGLASGIYMIKYTDDAHSETVRVNKQ